MNERTNRNGKEPFPSTAASRRHPAGVRKCARASTPSRCPQRAPAATRTADRHQPLPGAREPLRHGRIRGRPSRPHRSHSVRMFGELPCAPRLRPPLHNSGGANGCGPNGPIPQLRRDPVPRGPEPTPPPWRPRGHAPGRHWRPPLRLSRPTDTVPQRTPRRIADCEGPPCPR